MSTFKRYLGMQLMTFVFGIVGPIFLVTFFASNPDSNLKGFFWTGLFITYADIMIALALTRATGEGKTTSTKNRSAKPGRTRSAIRRRPA